MFLRTIKGKTKEYLVVAQAFRDDDGNPRQKIVKNLGSVESKNDRKRLTKIGNKLIKSWEK